jgi:hypothetical protein
MDESMDFTWTIPTSNLLSMLQDAYDHVLTPDEIIDWMFLTANRTYYAMDINTGRTIPIPEEVHFQMRKQNEDADLFNDVEPYDQDED